MRRKQQPRTDVLNCEDKEQIAKKFIQDYIEKPSRRPQPQSGVPDSFLLLARSPESPAAAAVAALSPEISDAGIKVRAIFSQFGNNGCALSWTAADLGITFARELRWARRPALLDAHEQLVLGPSTIWTGDCLRREPGKSGAYDCYGADWADAARCAAACFERFWQACEPVIAIGDKNAEIAGEDGAAATTVPAELAIFDEGAGEDGPDAVTRH